MAVSGPYETTAAVCQMELAPAPCAVRVAGVGLLPGDRLAVLDTCGGDFTPGPAPHKNENSNAVRRIWQTLF